MADDREEVSHLELEERLNEGLLAAAESGNFEAITALIRAGAWIPARTNADETALMVSAKHGHAQAVQILLFAGFNENLRDCIPALKLAVENGHTEVVRIY